MAAAPLFSARQLKVFDQLPADEITSKCYESFTQVANGSRPLDAKRALADLQQKTFGGRPELTTPPIPREIGSTGQDGVRLTVHEFESQPGVALRFYLARAAERAHTALHFEAVDETNWRQQLELARAGFSAALDEEFALAGVKTNAPVSAETAQQFAKWMRYIRDNQAAYITFAPRGVGATALGGGKKDHIPLPPPVLLLRPAP